MTSPSLAPPTATEFIPQEHLVDYDTSSATFDTTGARAAIAEAKRVVSNNESLARSSYISLGLDGASFDGVLTTSSEFLSSTTTLEKARRGLRIARANVVSAITSTEIAQAEADVATAEEAVETAKNAYEEAQSAKEAARSTCLSEVQAKRAAEEADTANLTGLANQIQEKQNDIAVLKNLESQLKELFNSQDRLSAANRALFERVLKVSKQVVREALGKAALGAVDASLYPTIFSGATKEAARLGQVDDVSDVVKEAMANKISRLQDIIDNPKTDLEKRQAENELAEARFKRAEVLAGNTPKGVAPLEFFNDAKLGRIKGGEFKVVKRSIRAIKKRNNNLAKDNTNTGRGSQVDINRSSRKGRKALRPDIKSDSKTGTGRLSRVGQVIKLNEDPNGQALVDQDERGLIGQYVVGGTEIRTDYDADGKEKEVKYVRLVRLYPKKVATALYLGGGTVETVNEERWVPVDSLMMHLSRTGRLKEASVGLRGSPVREIRRRSSLRRGVVFTAKHDARTTQPATPKRWSDDYGRGRVAKAARDEAIKAARESGRAGNRLPRGSR